MWNPPREANKPFVIVFILMQYIGCRCRDDAVMPKDLLPALLQKILRPGGRFCACEQVGRSQDGICLFPLFCAKMKDLGFIKVVEEKHRLDGSDLDFILFEFCAP